MDALPLSSREDWNRFWFITLLTAVSFFMIATVEQLMKTNIQQQITIGQDQEAQTQAIEGCPVNFSISGIYCLIIKSELLKLAETFSIVVAAWVFILDRSDRTAQAYREDWSLIDGARGSQTSGARYSAIIRLHQEKVCLKGLDAEGADLQSINLEGADLQGSNLQKADLQGATLIKADLRKARLQDANLKKANLQGAKLHLADLRGANLREANLQKSWLGAAKLHRAILRNANLQGAKLQGARFYYVDFRGANLENADLEEAEFIKPKYLTFEQIQKAKNWEIAEFSDEWCPSNPNIKRKSQENKVANGNQVTEATNKLKELQNIENMIDEFISKRYMSTEEFNNYLKNQQFKIPEMEKLRKSILSLEDMLDTKKLELEDIIEDINDFKK